MTNAICLLYDMCRLCLDEPGTLNIFENNKLIQDILLCSGILHISCSDTLPRQICHTCMYKMEIAKDLQRYSLENDLYMKSLLDANSIKHEMTKPRVPIGTVKPLQEVVTKTRISVRSLEDINSSFLPANSSDKKPTLDKMEKSSRARSAKRSTKTNKKRKIKCDRSPEKEVPSKIKTKRLSNEGNNTEDNGVHNSDSAPEKEVSPKEEPKRFSSEGNNSENNEIYKCDVCSKIYATRKKLYLHRRTHSKSLFCPLDTCGKSFVTKGDLQKHTRAHTGEKPYKCDLCDKSFTQNVTLKSHKDSVHVEKHT